MPKLELVARVYQNTHGQLAASDSRGVRIPIVSNCVMLADAVESAFYQLASPSQGQYVIYGDNGNGAALFSRYPWKG